MSRCGGSTRLACVRARVDPHATFIVSFHLCDRLIFFPPFYETNAMTSSPTIPNTFRSSSPSYGSNRTLGFPPIFSPTRLMRIALFSVPRAVSTTVLPPKRLLCPPCGRLQPVSPCGGDGGARWNPRRDAGGDAKGGETVLQSWRRE